MKAPRNTVADDPLLNLVVSMGKGGIEAQESRGQADLVNSDTLPTEGLASLKGIPQFTIGEPVPDDDLFTYVTLPPGWHKKGTSHSMWSELIDERGRKRAGIFYKAAFYDRRARVHLERRFSVSQDYDRKDKTGAIVAVVKDCDSVIFETQPRKVGAEEKYWDLQDSAEKEAKAWLVERRPDYENPLAYWDEQ
jgi:hypothetical protein